MIFNCRIYRNYQYSPLKEIYKKFQKRIFYFFIKKVLTNNDLYDIINSNKRKDDTK